MNYRDEESSQFHPMIMDIMKQLSKALDIPEDLLNEEPVFIVETTMSRHNEDDCERCPLTQCPIRCWSHHESRKYSFGGRVQGKSFKNIRRFTPENGEIVVDGEFEDVPDLPPFTEVERLRYGSMHQGKGLPSARDNKEVKHGRP